MTDQQGLTMEALVVTGQKKHGIARVPRPKLKPDHVLVRVDCVAMCGTDVRLLAGKMHDAKYPRIPGHEWAGTVVAAPDDGLVGARVVASNFVPCGFCSYCRSARQNLCPNLSEIGFDLAGACAEFVNVPRAAIRQAPQGISPEEACLLEPLGVALHAVDRSQPRPGESAVVVGGGLIGILVARLLTARGVITKILEISGDRQKRLLALGLDLVTDEQEATSLVVDASGSATAFTKTLDLAAPGGRVVLVGYSGDDEVVIRPAQLMLKELTVWGSLSGFGTLDDCLALVEARQIRLDDLVSASAPLSSYESILQSSASQLRAFFLPNSAKSWSS